MTCRKEAGGCGHEFCWICFAEWKVHGGDFYNCNKFDPKKQKEEEKIVKNAKSELERYVFFFNRYINHQKALQLGVKMRTTIQNTIKSFNDTKGLPYEELKYLENAVEAIIKSHRCLKNTYIFGYYMKDVNERQLFEHNQMLLGKEADVLHEDMEGEELKKLLAEDTIENFNQKWLKFKSNVINLSTVTVKYLGNLTNEIEMKLLEFVDYKTLNSR
jgi:ariadne-1